MKCTKVFGYVLLALLFISTVPYAAEAASVKIYPHQFKPKAPADTHNRQSPSYLLGSGGTATYYAVVSLPVGKRVRKLILYHSSNSPVNVTSCELYRVRLGEREQSLGTLGVFEDTDLDVVARSTTDISPRKVKSGYIYYVELWVANGNRVHGVTVKYQ